MMTVIAEKNEIPTSIHNGISSHDAEPYSSFIRDYREVDFHISASCKPFPTDLPQLLQDSKTVSSIEGLFFVQIDKFDPVPTINNRQYHNNQSVVFSALTLTVTDGVTSVKCIAQPDIPKLCSHIRTGRKLLIEGVIRIQDGCLQLTRNNTIFHFGSNQFPRPRSFNQTRGDGSYRSNQDVRRGHGNHLQSRNDNDNGDTDSSKHGPPKYTLKDFMPKKIIEGLKFIPNDDGNNRSENSSAIYDNTKPDNRFKNRTASIEKETNDVSTMDSNQSEMTRSNSKNDFNYQQVGSYDQLDHEDRLSHSSYRDRRNQLPPRFQRAQEERSRRSNNRNYDETHSCTDFENNGDYDKDSYSHGVVSSSTDYVHHQNQRGFVSNCSTNFVTHTPTQNPYAICPSMIPAISSSGQATFTYIGAPIAPMAYGVNDISTNPFPFQPGAIASYSPEHFGVWYPGMQPTVAYLPIPAHQNEPSDGANYVIENNDQNVDENEITVTNESQTDETNDSENRSQSSSIEPKHVVSLSSSSLNDGKTNFKKGTYQQSDERHRNSTPNPRPIWRVNDVCLARWHEDHEYYVAIILKIHPPTCTVQYQDYNTYDQVHFRDLKVLPNDTPYYPLPPTMTVVSSGLNPLSGAYISPYHDYYSSSCDGYPSMPEAPPFPFNPTGTVYINQSVAIRSNRDQGNSQLNNRENENITNDANEDFDATTNEVLSPGANKTSSFINETEANPNANVQQFDQVNDKTNRSANSNDSAQSEAAKEIQNQSENVTDILN